MNIILTKNRAIYNQQVKIVAAKLCAFYVTHGLWPLLVAALPLHLLPLYSAKL